MAQVKASFYHFYFNRNVKDLSQILKDHHMQYILSEETNDIIIRRSRILQTIFSAIQAKSFNCCKQLSVKFSGELGSDAGGPRRKFFRCMNCTVFSVLYSLKHTGTLICNKIVESNKNKWYNLYIVTKKWHTVHIFTVFFLDSCHAHIFVLYIFNFHMLQTNSIDIG